MSTLAVVLLGIVALGSLLQGVFLIVVARGGLRIVKRVDALHQRLHEELRPSIENIHRASQNIAEVSDIALLQARRVDDLVSETTARVQQTRDDIAEALEGPMRSVREAAAFLKGVRRGVSVYRQLGGLEAQARGTGRRYSEDDHLFI